MVREMQIRTWCDVCLAKDDEKVEGREITVAIGGRKPRTLTVCLRHETESVAPFLAVFEEYAMDNPEAPRASRRRSSQSQPRALADGAVRRAGQHAPIPAGEGVVCQLCVLLGKPEAEAVFKNTDSLSVHRGVRHKVTSSDYRRFTNGLVQPESADPDTGRVHFPEESWPDGIPDYLRCPDCGQEFDPRPKGEQSAFSGLTGHRVRQHPEATAA